MQPYALIGGDAADRAAQDALHDDRPVPGAARPAAHQQCQPVRHQTELRGAVVQLQQIPEHLFAVTFLHAPQIGEHADGLRLDPAERLGRRGRRRESTALAERELPEHRLDRRAQERLFRQIHLGLHRGAGLAVTEPGDHARQRLAGEPFHLGGQRVQLLTEPYVLRPQLVVDPGALRPQGDGLPLLPFDRGGEDVQQLALTRAARQRDPVEGVGGLHPAAYQLDQRGQRHVGGVRRVRFESGQRGREPFGLRAPVRGRAPCPPDDAVSDGERDGQDHPGGEHHRHHPAARLRRRQSRCHGSRDGTRRQHGHERGCRGPRCFRRPVLTGWCGFRHGCGPSVLPGRRCAAAPRRCRSPWCIGGKRKQPFLSGVDHIVDMLVRRMIRSAA